MSTPALWLGPDRGHAADWATQLWVKATGRQVCLADVPWLDGPVGSTTGIGSGYFEDLARAEGLDLQRGGVRGLLAGLDQLAGPGFDPRRIDPRVGAFYRCTSEYELEAWSEWCGVFRPFGWLLAVLFSRRLQQLNLPLSSLDPSRGTTSDIVQLVDRATGAVRQTAWVRVLRTTGHVLYAGSYSTREIPGSQRPCLRVVFPLPNGNAMVFLEPQYSLDGSLTVISSGRGFGDPGFYFTVHASDGRVWARYVRAMRERIRVYSGDGATDEVQADHTLWLWGARFLRLHYRLRPRGAWAVSPP